MVALAIKAGFSGTVQDLKETTFTLEYRSGQDFLIRPGWRRDFSNHPYFYAATNVVLREEQNTVMLGAV